MIFVLWTLESDVVLQVLKCPEHFECDDTGDQGRAETFGGAGAQSIKGAQGTRLLIGLCSLLICVSKWMLLY